MGARSGVMRGWIAAAVGVLAWGGFGGCNSRPPCPYPLVDGICPVECTGAVSSLCYPDGAMVESDAAVSDASDVAVSDASDGGSDAGDGADGDAANCTSGPCVRQVAVGDDHSCAVRLDGTVWCWGDNRAMQLGVGGDAGLLRPTQVPGMTGARQIAVGTSGTCVVFNSGAVQCWGENTAGQIGDGTTDPPGEIHSPVIGLSDAVQVARGEDFACARRAGGSIRCWGGNFGGQLGDGSRTDHSTPVEVIGVDHAVDLTASSQHACAVIADGSIKCWGDNASGDLGAGAGYDGMGPVEVQGFTNAAQVATGAAFTCAARMDHTAWCWGDDATEQLGHDPLASSQPAPVDVSGLSDAARVVAEGAAGCALSTGGTVSCWGHGSLRAAPVGGLSGVVDAAAGGGSVCVLFAGGAMSCWGANDSGQLGTGDTSDRVDPTPVMF